MPPWVRQLQLGWTPPRSRQAAADGGQTSCSAACHGSRCRACRRICMAWAGSKPPALKAPGSCLRACHLAASTVSALLEALGPPAQQEQLPAQASRQALGQGQALAKRASAAAADGDAPADVPSLPGSKQLEAGCMPSEDAIERKLQAAVACFLAESAQKTELGLQHAGRASVASQRRLQRQQLCRAPAAVVAPASATATAAAAARADAEREPPVKHGRPNRAADQHTCR